MDNKDIELQSKPSAEADKDAAPPDELPPKPPKRVQPQEVPVVHQTDSKSKRFSSFQRPEFIYKPENPESCMSCLKNTIIVFNLLIWLLGAVLTGVGIWVKVDEHFWDIQTGLNLKQFTYAGYILIAAGVLIMLIGFLGCYGAMAQKIWMLILYTIVIVIIIFLEIAVMAVVWSASTSKEMNEEMRQRAKKALQEMAEVESQQYLINLLQTKLKCCGVDSPDDYGDIPVPTSCTNADTGYPYEEGCLDAVVKYFKSKAGVMGGVAIAVFILQIGALALTLCLACGLKQAATHIY